MNKIYCPDCCKEIKLSDLLTGLGGCVYCSKNEVLIKDRGNEKTYYTKTLKNINSLKRGEKVLLKEDNRIYTIYDIYNIKEVSLSLFDYDDIEQDYKTNIKDILIKDKENDDLLYKDTIKKQFKKAYLKDCGKWLISGFKDKTQENKSVKNGFDNKIFKVFGTEKEADIFLKEVLR